jgi:hypothetical protein
MLRKKTNTVPFTLLTAFILMSMLALAGLLVACGNSGDGTSDTKTSDLVEIQPFPQEANGVAMTVYQPIFKQTPEEWNALSPEERERIAKMGFEQTLIQVETDAVSNYGILAKTSPGTDAADGQLAFILDLEKAVLVIYTDAEGSGIPTPVAEVAIELPSSS